MLYVSYIKMWSYGNFCENCLKLLKFLSLELDFHARYIIVIISKSATFVL